MLVKVFIFFFFLCGFSALAQEEFAIKGIIFQDGKSIRIEKASITNLRNQAIATADELGTFSIKVKLGDTLYFEKQGFQEFNKPILVKQNLIIYLKPSLMLDEVIVKQKTKGAEQREILDGYRSKGVFYNGNPPLLAYFFSPLTAIHEILSKDANDAKRFVNYIGRENAESLVDRHFNKSLIMRHTSIKEEDIAEFMYLYRPKADDVKYWNNYDDIKYAKDTYQKYISKKAK